MQEQLIKRREFLLQTIIAAGGMTTLPSIAHPASVGLASLAEEQGSQRRGELIKAFCIDFNWEPNVGHAKPGTFTTDPIGVLDVSILSNLVLDPLLGIKDQRTDKRIDFVGGIRGLGELEKRVNSGEMAVAFSLHPVTIQQLFDIADSGNVMPPKSTWFEPKLRDGLLTHLIYS